jgi:hypothetical protein
MRSTARLDGRLNAGLALANLIRDRDDDEIIAEVMILDIKSFLHGFELATPASGSGSRIPGTPCPGSHYIY